MVAVKITTFLALALIALGGLVSEDASAADRWVTLTSFSEVNRMKLIDDSVYLATSGGLLVAADPQSFPRLYTNLNGLGTTSIYDVVKDADDRLWVAGLGRLAMLGADDSQLYPFYDNDGKPFQLYALADDGEFLWVGTGKGLVLFSKQNDGGQIEDSYTQFGDLNPDAVVYDIVLDGDTIWLATSSGLAVADKSDPVALKAPSNWTVFGPNDFPVLGTGSMSRLAAFESDIYVGTERSALRLDREIGDTTFTELTIGRDSVFNDLKVENDTLFMYYSGGLAVVKDGVNSRINLTGLPTQNFKSGLNTGSYRWVDLVNRPIYQNEGGSFASYAFTGAPGNNVSDVAINRSGEVVSALTQQQIGLYDGTSWSQPFQPGASDGAISALADSSGDLWVGTFGNGMWRVSGDSIKNFDENNSTLRGNSDGDRGRTYVVVEGMATDGEYLFVACYRALNGHPVAVCRMDQIDTPSAWDSIGTPHGLMDTFVTSIACAPGNMAVGTEGDGIYWCRNGGSGDWLTDDFVDCVHFTKENRFLRSNTVRTVEFAPDTTLYVGTNFGISWYDIGIDYFVDIDLPEGISSDVTDIDFDGRGNMYVATKDGAARRDRTNGVFTTYTMFNSGLVSNDVRSVTVDQARGDVYFGTSSGISVLLSEIGDPTAVLDSVFAYPNPFVIDDANDRVRFNFTRPYVVSIHDLTGAVVRDNINTTSWDGKNNQGEQVASGVYIFVLTDVTGVSTRGKILLINNQ
ncbi:MAG: T9SS type A sorting domain-containing protein [bacterium]|nr:T9SS type A sorting domain-containing protein [bacterium]